MLSDIDDIMPLCVIEPPAYTERGLPLPPLYKCASDGGSSAVSQSAPGMNSYPDAPPPYTEQTAAPSPPPYQQREPEDTDFCLPRLLDDEEREAAEVNTGRGRTATRAPVDHTATEPLAPAAEPFKCHLILAGSVFVICGFVFGFAAFVLAIFARKKSRSNLQTSRHLGIASLVVSFLGIATGAIVIITSLAVTCGLPESPSSEPPVSCGNDYHFGDMCFRYRSHRQNYRMCAPSRDRTVRYDNIYCYYNCSPGLYEVTGGNCFTNRTFIMYTSNRCINDSGRDVYYDVSSGYCYHNCSNSVFYSVGGRCYAQKSSNFDRVGCVAQYGNDSFHDGIHCYHNCSAGMWLAGTKCFKYRTHDVKMQCLAVNGPYVPYGPSFFDYPYCYYNCALGYYSLGDLCFKKKIHTEDGAACISGANALYNGTYCYSDCSLGMHSFKEDCYAHKSSSYDSVTSCFETFGSHPLAHYDGAFCYYNCSIGFHSARDKCYRYKSFSYYVSCLSYSLYGPTYTEFPFCYHNCSFGFYMSPTGSCYVYKVHVEDPLQCTSTPNTLYYDSNCYSNCTQGTYSVSGQCYTYRSPANGNSSCLSTHGSMVDLYQEGGFCYFNCFSGYFYMGGRCYRYRSTTNFQCNDYSLHGSTFYQVPYCYHNCSQGLYSRDGNCYRHRTHETGTYHPCCRRYSPYGATYCGYPFNCYHNCSGQLYSAGENCYKYRVPSNSSTACRMSALNNTADAYYDGSYCYYNCSAEDYLIDGDCFAFRDVDYSNNLSCSAAFYGETQYRFPHCYYKCPLYSVGSACFNYRRKNTVCTESFDDTATSVVTRNDTYCYSDYSWSYCSGAMFLIDDKCFNTKRFRSLSDCRYIGADTHYDNSTSSCYYDYRGPPCSGYRYRIGGGCFNDTATGFSSAAVCSSFFFDSDTYFNAGNKTCYHNK